MRFWNAQTIFRLFIALILTLHTVVERVESYKFLGVLHFSAKSHFIVGSALMKGLAEQGHEVTVISAYPLKKPMKNYHDVPITGVLKVMEKETNMLLDTMKRSLVENIISFHDIGLQVTESVLNEPNVKALMASNQTFDAVICEVFLSEALYGLSEHFKAPLIGLGTFGAIAWNTDMPSYGVQIKCGYDWEFIAVRVRDKTNQCFWWRIRQTHTGKKLIYLKTQNLADPTTSKKINYIGTLLEVLKNKEKKLVVILTSISAQTLKLDLPKK